MIIPVYNAEKFIHKCMKNIINQTYKNFEVILVNDGSKDNSLELMRDYEVKYNFIKVITQENQGQGAARNKGIDISAGEYILFADIDDFMDEKAIEILYNTAKNTNADIVCCNMAMVEEVSGKKHYSPEFKKMNMNSDEAIRAILTDKEVKSYPWGKLYSREILIKNNIRFPIKMYYEDMATIIKTFYYAENIVFINDYLYFYLQNINSSTKTPNPKNLWDRLEALKIIKKFLIDNNIFNQYRGIFIQYCLYHTYILGCQINDWNLKIDMKDILHEVYELIEKRSISIRNIISTTLPKSIKLEVFFMCRNYNSFKMYTQAKKFRK